MRDEFVNALIEASASVLQSMLGQNIIVGLPFMRTPSTDDNSIGVCIGITGNIRGQIIFVMGKSSVCNIASKMIMMQVDDISDIVRSAINELANMITGNVGSLLFNRGIETNITTPTFIYGENLKYLTNDNYKSLCIYFEIDEGTKIEVEVSILNNN